MKVTEFLANNPSACVEAKNFLSGFETMSEAWGKCERFDWMIWALKRIGYLDKAKLATYAVRVVRETPIDDGRKVWDLLTDSRSRRAVEVAEKYLLGEGSVEGLKAYSTWAREAAAAMSAVSAAAAAMSAVSAAAAVEFMADYAMSLADDAAAFAVKAAVSASATSAADYAMFLAEYSAPLRFQANLLREVIGDPFLTV